MCSLNDLKCCYNFNLSNSVQWALQYPHVISELLKFPFLLVTTNLLQKQYLTVSFLISHGCKAHLNSPQYLCILYGWLTIQQHSYLEQLQSLHLATPSLCFRVVEISFYIIDFIFFLYWLQDSFPTVSKVTLPRFDKLKCETACVVQETNP